MALVSVVATIIGIAISLAIDWFPEQASTASDDIDLLYDVLLIASVPVFVLVMSVAIYSVLAFRAKPGDLSDGEPIHGNTRLEVIWVTIPFIMVSALAVYGWIVLEDIEAKKADTLVVNVTGQQFAWSFDYPAERVKSNQLVLPKDRPVEFRIKTRDVLHDFWVPEFRLKSDAVPGLTTKIRLTPSRLGNYDVVCAELCGIGHSTMRQSVRVIQPRAYQAWVDERKQSAGDGGAAAAGGDTAAAGKQLFTDTGCGSCHTPRRCRHQRRGRPQAGRAGLGGGQAGQVRGPVAGAVRAHGDHPSRRLRGQGLHGGRHAQHLRGRPLAGGDRHARGVPSRRGRRR